MKYIKKDTRLTLDEQKQIVELALLGRYLFSNPNLQQVLSAMIRMLAEKMLEGSFPSIDWIDKDEIYKYNNIDGITELEKIVILKIQSLLNEADTQEMRTVWMDIIDEIIYEINNNMQGNSLSSPNEKEYYCDDMGNDSSNVLSNKNNDFVIKDCDYQLNGKQGTIDSNKNKNITATKQFKWSEHFLLFFIISTVVISLIVFSTIGISSGLAVGLATPAEIIMYIFYFVACYKEQKQFKK